MKMLLKLILWLVGIAILLVVVAAIAVPMFFDPNDHKEQIVELVEKKTGRKLSLDGDIKLTVFPKIGATIEGVALGNAPGFGNQPMVKTDKVQVQVELLPLLRKEVNVDKIILHGAAIDLARNKAGVGNWEDLVPKDLPKEEKKDTPALALAAVIFGGIDLKDSSLSWVDQQTGQQYLVKDLNLTINKLVLGEPIDLSLSFNAQADQEGIGGDIALDGTIDYDLDAQRYSIKPLKLTALLAGEALPGGKVDVQLESDVAADLNAGTAQLSNLSLQSLGTQLTGNIQAKNILDPIPLVAGQVNLTANQVPTLLKSLGQDPAAVPLKSLIAQLKISSNKNVINVEGLNAKATMEGPRIPNGPVDVQLGATARVDVAAQTLLMKQFVIKGMGLNVQGAVKGVKIIDAPQLAGVLKIAPFNLRTLMTQLGQKLPETADSKVLNNVAVNTQFSATKNSLALKKLAARLDNTTLNGDLSVANFSDPAIKFGFNIDGINADRYLPPKKDGEKPKAVTPGAIAAGAATELPLETLRALKVQGNVNIGKLRISKIDMSDIKVNVNAKEGKIQVNPVAAHLFNGTYQGNIGLDASGKQPRIKVQNSIKGIQAGHLLESLTGESKIDGVAQGDVNISAVGADPDGMKKTLNGTAKFTFIDGALKGINIPRMIREAKAKLAGKTLPPSKEPPKTDFSELGGTFQIKNGVVSNQDLAMKSPLLRIDGKGQASLVSEEIDYSLETSLVKSLEGQGGKERDDLIGIPIPIRVTGTFDKPRPMLDIQALVKARAKKEFDKHKDKLKAQAEEKLKKAVGDQLGGALGETLGGLLDGQNKGTEKNSGKEAKKAPGKDINKAMEEGAEKAIKDLFKF